MAKKRRKRKEGIEDVVEDLNIEPPGSAESYAVRLIAYTLVLGGVSVVGSVFTGIFEVPTYGILSGTLARIAFGCAIVLIAYGILKRRRWALLGFAGLVVLSAFFNPVLALFLAAALVFLLSHRKHFHGISILPRWGL